MQSARYDGVSLIVFIHGQTVKCQSHDQTKCYSGVGMWQRRSLYLMFLYLMTLACVIVPPVHSAQTTNVYSVARRWSKVLYCSAVFCSTAPLISRTHAERLPTQVCKKLEALDLSWKFHSFISPIPPLNFMDGENSQNLASVFEPSRPRVTMVSKMLQHLMTLTTGLCHCLSHIWYSPH